jgi:isopenicillin-N N-acyltransferase-like protein
VPVSPARWPRVEIAGARAQRAHDYGRLAAPLVERTVRHYRALLEGRGMPWGEARERSLAHAVALDAIAPEAIEELRALSAGAGVPYEDVLTINCRTELLAHVQDPATASECSAACGPGPDGAFLAGQNWDWFAFAADSVVELDVSSDEHPGYVTLVEAGLLAKIGINDAGLGVMTNALWSADEGSGTGMPLHVMIQRLLESPSLDAALAVLRDTPRASSGNFLLVTADEAVDVETRHGGPDALDLRRAEGRPLAHTNHFRWGPEAWRPGADGTGELSNTSVDRLERLEACTAAWSATTVERLMELLADHDGRPASICLHADPAAPPQERICSVLSIVVDPANRRMWATRGNPCDAGFELIEPGVGADAGGIPPAP